MQAISDAPVLLVPDVLTTAAFYRATLGFNSDPGADTPEYTVGALSTFQQDWD